MSWIDDVRAVFPDAHEDYGTVTVDVEPDRWVATAARARDDLGCTHLDLITGVDRGEHVDVVARVCRSVPGSWRGLMLRTSAVDGAVESLTSVLGGAAWHERELHEMFGLEVRGHPALAPLLLPDGQDEHPLRKDVWLTRRQEKTWPGRKEPGESDATASPSRRRTLPPGVPPEPREGRR